MSGRESACEAGPGNGAGAEGSGRPARQPAHRKSLFLCLPGAHDVPAAGLDAKGTWPLSLIS